MLLRTTDPFRDFERLASQVLGTTNRPAVMPMDAWRQGDVCQIEFVGRNGDWEMLASERPRGVFSRQLVLGDNLDLDQVEANYDAGVLRLSIPVAERAKPRRIEVTSPSSEPTAIEA
jgi:HSP20 family protein